MRDPLTLYIDCALLLVRRDYARDKVNMALEIKGLGNAVQAARSGIAEVRTQSAGLTEDVQKLSAALQDVRKQVRAAQADLEFEAQTLGNSSSNDSSQDSQAAETGAAPGERANLHDTKEG